MVISRSDLFKYAPDRPSYETYTSEGSPPQVTPYTTQLGRAALFTGASAGIAAGTYYGAAKLGYNLWDPIYAGLRTAEEFSPGNILRTFQLGNFASQFTTENKLPFDKITADVVKAASNSAWFQDLRFRAGPKTETAIDTGLQFRDGKLFAGNNLLLENATMMTIEGQPHLPAAISRAQGFQGIPQIKIPEGFNLHVPIEGQVDKFHSVSFQGGATKGQAIWNQVKGIGTDWVERANRLADAPFGMEPFTTGLEGFQSLWGKIGDSRFTLGVRPGSGTQTLGRMALKWGGAGTAAYLGYKTLDWGVRNFPLFNPTSFDKGITAGVAKIGVDINRTAASIADYIPGLRTYRDKQEELAPGSTSLMHLAAFPIAGAVTGGFLNYGARTIGTVRNVPELMKQGYSYTSALPIAREKYLQESEEFFSSKIPNLLKNKKIPFIGNLTRTKSLALMGAALFALPILPFLPGALIPSKSREELDRIYSGEQEIAVRKNRWWELSASPHEGGKIDFYRPHWFPRMMQDSYGESMYGGSDPNPIGQFFKENFTYGMEREHYYDRPYPITGTPFQDVPVIGPILGATIGRLIKPPKYMHEDEWNSESGVVRPPGRMGEISPGEGETGPGRPVDPNSFKQAAGEQIYRLSELSGLVGFTGSSIKKMITGEEEFFDQEEVLQSSNRAFGSERRYWDLNLGGLGGTTELFRRWFPHRRKQIQEYNPIRNQMPSWMPGEGERSQDFKRGDPFLITEGELRLPGAGYAARFPELKGVDPEDYPDIHKYKILADVAPYAERTKIAGFTLQKQANRGLLSPEDLALFQTTKAQLKSRKVNKEFAEENSGPMDYTIPGTNQSSSVLAAINNETASRTEPHSIISSFWNTATSALRSNPLETLTPIAPGNKLLGLSTAIEDYKRTKIWGPDLAMWQTPVKSFILPFFRQTSDVLFDTGIPEDVQKRRGIEEYFDVLQYVKNKRLAEIARDVDAGEVSGAYERTARETSIGINPYTRDLGAIFRALPRSERDYFSAFTGAKTPEERADILNLVPANTRRIYQAQWEQQYADKISAGLESGSIPEGVRQEAEQELEAFYQKRNTEGFPVTDDYAAAYAQESESGESYGDWYRRSVMIPEVVGEEGLPGPDWVGFNPQVNLDEIKLKVVKNEALNIHDFNLWDSTERSAAQKPYLDDAAEQMVSQVVENDSRSIQQVQSDVRRILSELGIGSNAQIMISEVHGDTEQVKIDIHSSELRDHDIKQALNKRIDELG